MPDPSVPDLGPWSQDDLETTTRITIPLGVDIDLASEVRFLAGVAKLIRRRIAETGKQQDTAQPAIFLLNPHAPTSVSGIATQRVPMLNNGLTQLNGRFWFVASAVVMGWYVDFNERDDDDLFHIVTDELDMGTIPAVVYDPRPSHPKLRFYPQGLQKPDICRECSIEQVDISLEKIFDQINRIHAECLITPDAQSKAGKLWKKASRYWPSEHAESIVQMYLRTGLTTAFPTCTIRREQQSVSGRLDLEIEENDPSDRTIVTRHAVLELKVLRSYSYTGQEITEKDNLDWVDSGVKQAASYRDERRARQAALCCFDMRRNNTGDICFTHVSDLSRENKVALRIWFIYSSSKRYREALITT